MKDSHLTLRIPADLARLLARRARDHGLPKSQVAREAVVRYLAGGSSPAEATPRVTAQELAVRWARVPRLSPDEAKAMARDLAAARKALPAPRGAWE